MRQVIMQVLLTDFRLMVLRNLRRARLVAWSTAALLGVEKKYPYYHFGLALACREAQALGYTRIRAIEFGVAGGSGLISLSKAAQSCSKEFGIEVDVLGFDSGQGMLDNQGFEDAPYLWNKGDFLMDQEILRKALPKSTNVILGDVSKTVKLYNSSPEEHGKTKSKDGLALPNNEAGSPQLSAKLLRPDIGFDARVPIAFISFDLDFYSATYSALEIFHGAFLLPRVWGYFDDLDYISRKSGEWLAIDQFNLENESHHISEVGLSLPSWVNWAHRMRVVHLNNHPLYTKPLNKQQQLPLN